MLRFYTTHAIDLARLFEFHAQASTLPYFHSVHHAQREYQPGVVTNTMVRFEAPSDLVEAVIEVAKQMPSYANYGLPTGTVLPPQRPLADLRAAQVSGGNSASTPVPASPAAAAAAANNNVR